MGCVAVTLGIVTAVDEFLGTPSVNNKVENQYSGRFLLSVHSLETALSTCGQIVKCPLCMAISNGAQRLMINMDLGHLSPNAVKSTFLPMTGSSFVTQDYSNV